MDDLLIHVFPDLPAVSRAAAENFAERAREAIDQRGRFTVALSGGRTPREMHRLLAEEFRDQVDWSKVHIFFGDEPYVPHDDPRSNYQMAQETLLRHVPIPADHIHPMPADSGDPETGARAYELLLGAQFGPGVPELDLVLLGMGPDGHTASIFPGTPAVPEWERLAMAVRADVEPPVRLTLTLPVWEGIQANPAEAAQEYPAAMVAVAARQTAWYVDQSLDG